MTPDGIDLSCFLCCFLFFSFLILSFLFLMTSDEKDERPGLMWVRQKPSTSPSWFHVLLGTMIVTWSYGRVVKPVCAVPNLNADLKLLFMQMSGSGAEGISGIIVQGGESYGLDDPRAEMDLLRHEIDISIDQKLKGVEKRLQVGHALTALRQHLMTDLDNRFQLFDSRLQVRNMSTFTALAVAFIMNYSHLQIQ